MSVRLAVMVACVTVVAFIGPATAFERGCHERYVECYAHGPREVVLVPAIVQARPYRVEVAPQRVYREHVPAVYGAVVRHELVHSGYTTYAYQPPVVERRYETLVTQPSSFRWERTVGRHGEERLCKVAVPARVRHVARDVVVVPARHRSVSTPAVYRDVAVPVELSPAHTRHVIAPAVHDVVYRPVVLRPAEVHVVDPVWLPVHRHDW